ncbi:MAG: HPF/RaiA family ribosome-associated protein, partial [Ottowia sp.]|nr:HPF/RaiA family ribosome-associated protein [Ottowia sp.]
MHIQVNTDKNISGHDSKAQNVREILERILDRFADQITRLEVHLSDQNSASKPGVIDKRCLLEARLAGRQPTSASNLAPNVELAVTGAAHKMASLL